MAEIGNRQGEKERERRIYVRRVGVVTYLGIDVVNKQVLYQYFLFFFFFFFLLVESINLFRGRVSNTLFYFTKKYEVRLLLFSL